MYIVEITSEIAPIAKAGGLADVILGLSRKIRNQGHEIEILLPNYGFLPKKELVFSEEKAAFLTPFGEEKVPASGTKVSMGVDINLVLLDSKKPFFNREEIYGYPDDVERFLFFSKSALHYLMKVGKKVDVLHLHDWEAAPIAFLVKDPEFSSFFKSTRVVLTIHNMEYQGKTSLEIFSKLSSNVSLEAISDAAGCINLLKSGILFADALVTVSPTYAKEVMEEDGAKGLLEPLRQNSAKFSGILNGIDYEYWNPEKDPFIAHKYSKDDLAGKIKMKKELLEELSLEISPQRPLLASISRIVPQKGLHLLKYILKKADDLGITYVLMGTTFDDETKTEFQTLEAHYKKHPHIRIVLEVNESLAHRLYAASDMFIVPSLFEPCGLTQMIALRYGSIPIVRKTGGLIDTVFDIEYSDKPPCERNGFVFDHSDSGGIDFALERAVTLFSTNPKDWQELMHRGMSIDYSWNRSAGEYLSLFSKISEKHV